jgi:GTPase SAR1 family protein
VPKEKVRIAILGDSGVGKTSWLKWLFGNSEHTLSAIHPTVGAALEVSEHGGVCIEWVDIGARCKSEHSHRVFLSNVQAVVLVHDLCSRRSYSSLWKWLDQVQQNGSNSTDMVQSSAFSITQGLSNRNASREFSIRLGPERDQPTIPILVVGTKIDRITTPSRELCELSNDIGATWIDMTTLTVSGLPSITYRPESDKDPRAIVTSFLDLASRKAL